MNRSRSMDHNTPDLLISSDISKLHSHMLGPTSDINAIFNRALLPNRCLRVVSERAREVI